MRAVGNTRKKNVENGQGVFKRNMKQCFFFFTGKNVVWELTTCARLVAR